MIMLALCLASLSAPDLKSDGAQGFPQKTATVLCDTDDLRVSLACDGKDLFVQAILWKDGDSTVGLTSDGRKIGDNSVLVIDADGDGKPTKDVDREYMLDPWPQLPGLHYSVCMGPNASSGIQKDSKGRGSIQYVEEKGGKVRVDTYLIPLDELKRKDGEAITLAFWASSAKPELAVNSVGFSPKDPARKYYSHSLPREKFHAWKVARTEAGAFDGQKVLEGRGTIALKPKKDPPKVGAAVGEAGGPPEISAQGWKNWSGEKPPTLASLKGKVVVVEFWATWCGPCVAGIPHLNEVYTKHKDEGLVVLSMTDQDQSAISKWVEARKDMTYPVGMGSDAVEQYGVSGIPHAFIIGKDGKLLWSGNPGEDDFEKQVEAALKPH